MILEEMSMYYDDPDGALQDEFDAVLFGRHSMGMNILGRPDSVKKFSRRHFQDFIRANLDTRKIVFSVVGNIPFEKVVELSEKYFGKVPKILSSHKRKKFHKYVPEEKVIERPVQQGKCAIGRTAFNIHDDRRVLFYFINNILGGPGMNSKLNLALREKHGYVYSIGSQYVPFSDTGIFVISFGTDPKQIPKAIELVKKELNKMTDQPMGSRQLSVAKEQFLGQMAMAEENNGGYMMMMGRSILDLGFVPSLDEMFQTIKKASTKEVQQMARVMFDEREMSTLVLKPTAGQRAIITTTTIED